MRKILIFLMFGILFSSVIAESIDVIQSNSITRVNASGGASLFPFGLSNKLFVNTEEPPLIIGDKAYITSGWTYSLPYSASNNFVTNPNGFQSYSLTNPVLSIGGGKYVDSTDINNPIRVSPFPMSDAVLASKNPPFWSRHYYGGYSAEKVGNETILFTHGENKNEYENNICYQNSIDSSVSCSSCYSGTNPQGVYSDCARAYSSFFGMVHSSQNTGVGFIDEGPVIWPTTGYSQKNTVTSAGSLGMASHANSIINGTYIYLFYFNNGSGTSADARNQGIKVARGLISDNGRPGSFQTWYKLPNGTEGWEDSLPSTWYSNGVYVTDTGKSIYSEAYKGSLASGWIKLNGEDWYNFGNNWLQKGATGNDLWWNYGNGWMTRNEKGFKGFNNLDNYDINGGRASNILGEDETTWNYTTGWWSNASSNDKNLIRTATTEFIVAKLKGTEYFIGVENDFGWQIVGSQWNSVAWTGLRVSKDLVHWGDLYVLKDTIVPTWNDLKLGHAKFLSSDFSTNKEVDPNGFYLIGSHGAGVSPCSSTGCWQQLNYKYLKINIVAPTCTSFTYSDWSPATCPQSGTQTRTILTQTPTGCQGGNPALSQPCTYTPTCTNENWTYSDGACQSNNTLTRTWSKIGTCSGGITHPATESASCTYQAPTCTTFTYNPWAPTTCPQSATQTRTIATQTPVGCQGGTPILSQSCIYTPPCTESDWTFSDGQCLSSNTLTRTWNKLGTCTGGVTHPITENVNCNYQAPICTVFTYSDWSPNICPQSGIQTRTTLTSTPTGCQGGAPILSQSCTYIPTCTETDWTHTDGTCQSNNTLTRNWSKINNCTNGVIHSASESIACNYTAPTCETFTYSDWTPTVCPQSQTQTRTILTKTPTNCQSGNQEPLTRSCTYTPTCTDSYWDFNLIPSICPSNGQQTKKYFKVANCLGGVTKTDENISCTYNSPQCQYTYTNYGDCINGIQTRTATATNQPCQGQPSNLTKTCTNIPTCTESNWSFSLGDCVNGIQLKDWTKISDCNNGIQHVDENISCTEEQEPLPYCGSSDWTSRIEPTACPSTGKQTKYWTRTNSNCQAGETHQAQETINCNYNSNPTTCTNFSYSEWSNCTNGLQTRTILTSTPTGCTGGNPEPLTKNCNNSQPTCAGTVCSNQCYTTQGICCNEKWNPNFTTCDYNFDEVINETNKTSDPESLELIQKAIESANNGNLAQADVEAKTAKLKAQIIQNGNPTELTTLYNKIKTALNNQDYEQANNLLLQANQTMDKQDTQPNYLFEITVVVLIMIILILGLLLFGGKPKNLSPTQQAKKELMEELRKQAKQT